MESKPSLKLSVLQNALIDDGVDNRLTVGDANSNTESKADTVASSGDKVELVSPTGDIFSTWYGITKYKYPGAQSDNETGSIVPSQQYNPQYLSTESIRVLPRTIVACNGTYLSRCTASRILNAASWVEYNLGSLPRKNGRRSISYSGGSKRLTNLRAIARVKVNTMFFHHRRLVCNPLNYGLKMMRINLDARV